MKTKRILEMIRFSHTIFALPFALLAAVIAWRTPTISEEFIRFQWLHLAGILVCMVAARSAAMAFNRLVDRDIDAANPRTEMRHIPAGLLSVQSVIAFTVVSCLAFIFGTLFFLPNRLPLFLSVPVLGVLLFYSYTKRLTALAHFWLGFSLMLAPVAVWIALRGEWVIADPRDLTPALMLGLAVLFWVSGFDIIYACQDAEFDRENRLKSVPSRWGLKGALRIACGSHVAMVFILLILPGVAAAAGVPTGLGWIYFGAVMAVAVLLVYEHRIIRPDDLKRVNTAFFNVNAVVSFGLFLAGAIDLMV